MSKNVIVTGASRGIGAATAKRAGQKGWRICVNYNGSPDRAAEVVSAIEASGSEAFAFKAKRWRRGRRRVDVRGGRRALGSGRRRDQ